MNTNTPDSGNAPSMPKITAQDLQDFQLEFRLLDELLDAVLELIEDQKPQNRSLSAVASVLSQQSVEVGKQLSELISRA